MFEVGDLVIYVGEDTEWGMCGYVLEIGKDEPETDGYVWEWASVELYGYGHPIHRSVKDWVPVYNVFGNKYNINTNPLPDPY